MSDGATNSSYLTSMTYTNLALTNISETFNSNLTVSSGYLNVTDTLWLANTNVSIWLYNQTNTRFNYNMTDTIYYYNMTDHKYFYNMTDTIYYYNMTDHKYFYNMTDTIYYYNMSDGATNSSYALISDTRNSTSWNRTGTIVYLANGGDTVGFNNSAPTHVLDVVGSYNLTSSNKDRTITTNETCVMIYGPTSTFSVC
jgi:hypothetical protein